MWFAVKAGIFLFSKAADPLWAPSNFIENGQQELLLRG
jgi:hypothetical protein